MPETIRVEVVYADASRQTLRSVELAAGATVDDAIRAAQILDFAPTDFTLARVGIFGRIVARSAVLREGDRVELYRPLKIDPKEARRRRVTRQRTR